MSETFALSVYRRDERLWVAAYVLAEVAQQAVDDLYPADRSVEGLTRALIEAERRARKEMSLPRSERCRNTKGFWLAAGCKSWRIFMRGLTACDITRETGETMVSYWVPDPKYPGGLTGTDISEIHPADISYEELARIVLRIFAEFPPEMKVPAR